MYGNVENIARLSSVPQISNSACNNKLQSKQKRTNDAAGWRWNSCRNDCFNRRTLTARRGIFNWTRAPSQYWNSLFLVFQDCWFSRTVPPLHSEGFQLQPAAEGKATLSERCLCISSSPCPMVKLWNIKPRKCPSQAPEFVFFRCKRLKTSHARYAAMRCCQVKHVVETRNHNHVLLDTASLGHDTCEGKWAIWLKTGARTRTLPTWPGHSRHWRKFVRSKLQRDNQKKSHPNASKTNASNICSLHMQFW